MQSHPSPLPWSEAAKAAFWLFVIMLVSAAVSFGYLWYAVGDDAPREPSVDVNRPVPLAVR